MSNKKKPLPDDLLDLKIDTNGEMNLDSDDLNLDLSELELGNQATPPDDRTAVASGGRKDKTVRLVHSQVSKHPEIPETPAVQQSAKDTGENPVEVKVSYGLPSKQQVPRPFPEENQGELKQSEHLRIAQRKINDLEDEVSKLRREHEDIASAAETFKSLNDEYYATIESLKSKVGDQKQSYSQEVELLKNINQNKDKQISELKQQIEDYKSRIDNNFQRVRKREKDLEHRLEIAKMEEAAVVKSKDQLILDLKRRIDELSIESDNFRKKSQENYKELQKKQQVVRGVIRALRIALTKLEGDDDSDFGLDNMTQPGVEDEQ